MRRMRHQIGNRNAATPMPAFAGRARGPIAAPFVDHADETVPTSYGLARLDAGGDTALLATGSAYALRNREDAATECSEMAAPPPPPGGRPDTRFADGGLGNPHGHPFEEAGFIVDGAVDITVDGIDYTLKKGDYAWTGVGSQHAFFAKKGQPARRLEVQAPQPPAQGDRRCYAQWDYINTALRD